MLLTLNCFFVKRGNLSLKIQLLKAFLLFAEEWVFPMSARDLIIGSFDMSFDPFSGCWSTFLCFFNPSNWCRCFFSIAAFTWITDVRNQSWNCILPGPSCHWQENHSWSCCRGWCQQSLPGCWRPCPGWRSRSRGGIAAQRGNGGRGWPRAACSTGSHPPLRLPQTSPIWRRKIIIKICWSRYITLQSPSIPCYRPRQRRAPPSRRRQGGFHAPHPDSLVPGWTAPSVPGGSLEKKKVRIYVKCWPSTIHLLRSSNSSGMVVGDEGKITKKKMEQKWKRTYMDCWTLTRSSFSGRLTLTLEHKI